MKVTFLGAGSTVFARNVLGDCLLSGLKDFEIALYDIDEVRLQESYVIIEAMRKKYNRSVKVKKYTARDFINPKLLKIFPHIGVAVLNYSYIRIIF